MALYYNLPSFMYFFNSNLPNLINIYCAYLLIFSGHVWNISVNSGDILVKCDNLIGFKPQYYNSR